MKCTGLLQGLKLGVVKKCDHFFGVSYAHEAAVNGDPIYMTIILK